MQKYCISSPKIDEGIKKVLIDLNNAGLETMYSCSGLREDHKNKAWNDFNGYIAFKTSFNPYSKQNEILFYLAKIIRLRYLRNYQITEGNEVAMVTLSMEKLDSELIIKRKLKLFSDASFIIKEKGIENITAEDLCKIKKPAEFADYSTIGQFLEKLFDRRIKAEIHKDHILSIDKQYNFEKFRCSFREFCSTGKVEIFIAHSLNKNLKAIDL